MKRLISIAVILSVFLLAVPSYGSPQGSTAKPTGKVVVTPKTGTVTYPNAITLSAIFVPSKPYDGTLDQSMEWSVTPKSALNYVKVDNGVVTWSANPSKDIKNVKFVAKSVSYKKSAYAKLTLKKGSNEPPAPVESINITPTSKTLEYGDDPFQFNVSSVDGDSYLWCLSNTKYLSVDGSGLVTVTSNPAIDISATLTVTSENLKKAAVASITVKHVEEEPVDPEIDWTFAALNTLAANTTVDPTITTWRNTPNGNRSGFDKQETKYFDIYYHASDPKAIVYRNEIAKYADAIFMFYYKIYGTQVPVDVYIGLSEAPGVLGGYDMGNNLINLVIKDDSVSYPGNILRVLTHEFQHAFFMNYNSQVNLSYMTDYFTFVNEGTAYLSMDIFLKYMRKTEKVDASYYTQDKYFIRNLIEQDINMKKNSFYPSIDVVSERWKQSGLGSNWTSSGRDLINFQQIALFMWYLYDTYGIEKVIELDKATNITSYKARMENVYGKTMNSLDNDFYARLNGAVTTGSIIERARGLQENIAID